MRIVVASYNNILTLERNMKCTHGATGEEGGIKPCKGVEQITGRYQVESGCQWFDDALLCLCMALARDDYSKEQIKSAWKLECKMQHRGQDIRSEEVNCHTVWTLFWVPIAC